MNQLLYSQRIFWPQYNTPQKLDRLLAFLGRHRPVAEEISFFTEGDGMDWRFVPPDEVERRASVLVTAVRKTREAGFVPVINVLNTLVHSDEGGPEAPLPPWRTLVGIDGTRSRTCSCPAEPRFLDYVHFKYRQFARSHAQRYWIDDDLRIGGHKPVGWGCFCDACVTDFSRRVGRSLDRAGLADQLRTDRALRAAWYDRNGEVMLEIIRAAARGVAESHPGAEMGIMTTDVVAHIDIRPDFGKWFGEISRITGGACWLRPGGGFWEDETPRGMLSKGHGVANAIDRLPDSVRATYEIENYPYTVGSKSVTMTGIECLTMIASTKLDGVMFNVLDLAGNDPAVTHGPWLEELQRWHPLWEQAAALVRGTIPAGWRPIYSMRHFEQHVEDRPPLEIWGPTLAYRQPLGLQRAGLPLTGFAAGAAGHLLSGDASLGMSRQELEDLLERPLIMDGFAARRYLDLGLGDRIGVRALHKREEGAYEQFTDHTLNGPAAGYLRGPTMAYFNARSHAIEPAAGSEVLSTLHSYAGGELGAALTLHRPPGAAPVAVVGHMPWINALSPQRMRQLQALSRAMLGTAVPLRIETRHPVVLWYRKPSGDGQAVTVLLNTGMDPAAVRLEPDDGHPPTLALATPGVEQPESGRVIIPAWGMALLRSEVSA